MKKALLVISALTLFSCNDGNEPKPQNGRPPVRNNDWPCGTYNGKTLYTGPRGCYYITSDNKEEFVDRRNCNC